MWKRKTIATDTRLVHSADTRQYGIYLIWFSENGVLKTCRSWFLNVICMRYTYTIRENNFINYRVWRMILNKTWCIIVIAITKEKRHLFKIGGFPEKKNCNSSKIYVTYILYICVQVSILKLLHFWPNIRISKCNPWNPPCTGYFR